MVLGGPLPPLTRSFGDRRSGMGAARPPKPVFAGSGRFWGRWKEQPGRGDDPGYLTGGLLHHLARLLSFLATLAARRLLTVFMGD